MKLSKLGILGLISLLSYTAMVVLSPLAYPGYYSMTILVTEQLEVKFRTAGGAKMPT